MIPSTVILDAIQDLLAADPATLAPVALPNHVHLAIAPFTPSPDLLLAGLTEATFTDSFALNVAVGTQQTFIDGLSGLRVIQMIEPEGGWHWECTAGTGLPQTVYGYYVTDNADAVLIGSALLDIPVVIIGAGQAIDLPWVRFTFNPNSPT